MIISVYNMIEHRLTTLEKWEAVFAEKADQQLAEYCGALYQCHNERFFLTQLKKECEQAGDVNAKK